MNKRHLSKMKILFAGILMTLMYCAAVMVLYVLSGIRLNVPELAEAFIILLPLLLPHVADIILRIKTDIHPLMGLLPAFLSVIIFFIFYVIYPTPENSPYFGDNYIYFIVSLINFAVSSIISAICVIRQKNCRLRIISFVLVLASFGFLTGGIVFSRKINSYLLTAHTGTADKTGSWASINQEVTRSENWQQLVTDSPFKLGEISTVSKNGESNNYCDKGTYPNIDGSTVCVPLAVEFARQHLGFEDRTANQFVQFSTTHKAYENLMHPSEDTQHYVHYNLDAFIKMGSVDLIIATEPSDDEIRQAEDLEITLIKTPVCYDAFVFITHKDNPVDNLSVEQIKKIYTGEITNWKDVGGKNEKIRAFQREKNSGSQTAMENLVMGGENMKEPIKARVIEGMGQLVDAVAEYENETASIGYTYRYYIDTLYKNDNIKTISVNGTAPTDDNIRSGAYPFATNYYGVIRGGDEENVGGQFLNWILSDEGQKCVEQAGYITLR